MFNHSHIRLDAKGRALTGERRYTITFKPFAETVDGRTGFWSHALCRADDPDGLLVGDNV